MEKMMRPKVDIEGKVTKLSTTGSRLTTAESAGSNRLNVGAPIPTSPTAKTPIVESAKQTQSTMSRQLPDGVDELSILRQISDGLKLKGGRTQRAEIRLHPEELGTVEIKMQVKGDAVRVSVFTEHAAVGDLLTNSLEQLKKDILAQGMHIEHIEVNSQLAGEGGQEGHGQNETDDANENEGQDAHRETVTRFHDGRLHVRA